MLLNFVDILSDGVVYEQWVGKDIEEAIVARFKVRS
jgi:hypothetical protein